MNCHTDISECCCVVITIWSCARGLPCCRVCVDLNVNEHVHAERSSMPCIICYYKLKSDLSVRLWNWYKVRQQRIQINQRSNIEQVNTVGQKTNDRTQTKTGLDQKQRHKSNSEIQYHCVALLNNTCQIYTSVHYLPHGITHTHLASVVVFHLPAAWQLKLLVGKQVQEGDQVSVVLVAFKVLHISPYSTDHVLQTRVACKHAIGTLKDKGKVWFIGFSFWAINRPAWDFFYEI